MTARVQNFKGQATGVASLTVAPTTANFTNGNLVAVAVFYGDDTTTASINDPTLGANKDSAGNVYSTLGPLDFTTDGDFLYIFYTVVTAGGSKPNIRILASSGTHSFRAIGNEYSPTNSWSLDQSITSAHNASGTALSAGSQTPTTAAGVALVAYGVLNGETGLSMDSTFAVGQIITADGWLITGDTIYSSTATLTPSATISVAQENGGVLAVFKDATGGATSKTDTDTGTLSESATALTNKTTGTPDTATLTEQTPKIALGTLTDSLTFTETQTVTPSGGTISKSDTDTATLTETAPGPQVQVTDTASLSESAITLVVTDVTVVPDFTLSEQTPRITLAPTDSLTFTEQQTLTASFIRFTDTDSFGVTEQQTPWPLFLQTDSLTTTEILTLLLARNTDADTGLLSEAQTVTPSGSTPTGDLQATLSVGPRLTGTVGVSERLEATMTVQPAGRP